MIYRLNNVWYYYVCFFISISHFCCFVIITICLYTYKAWLTLTLLINNIVIFKIDLLYFVFSLAQAKSPIKTLDEFCVSEVVPSMHFPSVIKIEKNSTEAIVGETSKIGPPFSNGLQNDFGMYTSTDRQAFGQIQKHRCFIVTARARSFLYHQVSYLVFHLKYYQSRRKYFSHRT